MHPSLPLANLKFIARPQFSLHPQEELAWLTSALWTQGGIPRQTVR